MIEDANLSRQLDVIDERGLEKVVERFLQHVKSTHEPESFSQIVMQPPTSFDDEVIALTKFELDINQRKNKKRAPCSVCSPNGGKFYKIGYLIYHVGADELRIVGRTCCRNALKDWDQTVSDLGRRARELERRKQVKEHAPAAEVLRERLEDLLVIAEMVRSMRSRLRNACPNLWKILLHHAKFHPTSLTIDRVVEETRLNQTSGDLETVRSEKQEKVADFAGATFCQQVFEPLKDVRRGIQLLETYSPEQALEKLERKIDGSFPDYFSNWLKAKRIYQKVTNDLDSVFRFFVDYNLECLKKWGQHYQMKPNFKIYKFEDGRVRFREESRDSFAEFTRREIDDLKPPALIGFFE